MMVSKRDLLFQGAMFRFHVKLQGCMFFLGGGKVKSMRSFRISPPFRFITFPPACSPSRSTRQMPITTCASTSPQRIEEKKFSMKTKQLKWYLFMCFLVSKISISSFQILQICCFLVGVFNHKLIQIVNLHAFFGLILKQELSNLLRPVEVHNDLSIDHVTSWATRGNPRKLGRWFLDTTGQKFVNDKINEFRISKNWVQ